MTATPSPNPPPAFDCDAIVIGGGPAGSTVAARLAQKGRRVVVLDKDRHPRFHIGESLLPANLPLLDQLGVGEAVRAIGMKKLAAEFVSPQHDNRRQQFYFSRAWDKSMPTAWQVRRSDFDHILLDNAARLGAQVHQQCRATAVDFWPGDAGVTVQARHDDGREQSWSAPWLVDATGRDSFLANRFQIKHKNPKHASLAVYGHFTGARRNAGEDEGNITIFWFDHGWFWFIPLQSGVTSIGMVVWPYYMKQRGARDLLTFLMDSIATCGPLAERMVGAECVHEVEATGNFSYTSERNHGPCYLMVGDAYAFIDPVFSSGVMLAMQGGFAAADCIDRALADPRQRAAALRQYDRVARHGPREFSWFIYRMTNPIMRDLMMDPRNHFRAEEAVISVLAGDIYGQTPIWRSLRFLKGVYYTNQLQQLPRAIRAWRRRRRNIRSMDGLDLRS